MDHSVEVKVYILDNPEAIEYDEIPLEVTFDVDLKDNSWNITGYVLEGNHLSYTQFKLLKENNPSLDARIDREIDHYITNYEEEFNNEDW